MTHGGAQTRRDAERIAASYRSPRYLRLDRLERYADGTQYEGRPSWWNDDVPLHERAPCLRAPIVERAIRGHVDLSLGLDRFPRLTSHPSEDDSDFDEELGLSADESRVLDRFVQAVIDQARIPAASADLMTRGMECGSAISIATIRNGRIVVDTTRAKFCMPTLGPDGETLRLEIRYAYISDVKLDGGAWSCEARLFRRVIDERRDVTYQPAKASENGEEPDAWIEDPALTVEHGLGFCPVVWWRRERQCTLQADVDGLAPHQNLLAEIDGLNFSLSQRHRAARYAGDPQIIETGVSEDGVRAPTGRASRSMYQGENDHPANKGWMLYTASGQPMRKRGPGSVWSYESSESKVNYLTLPAGALESLTGDVKDLYALVRDALGYVDLDPGNVRLSADLSGKTIEWLHQNAVNFCNRLRPDFAEGCLLPLVSMLLRLVHRVSEQGKSVRIAGFQKVAPILAKFSADGEWSPPTMRVVWGDYFKPTEADRKSKQERVLAALDAGLITLQTAVEEIACLYPSIKDPGAYLEALKAEREEKLSTAHATRKKLDDMGVDEEGEEPEVPDAPAPPLASMREQAETDVARKQKAGAAESAPRARRTINRLRSERLASS